MFVAVQSPTDEGTGLNTVRPDIAEWICTVYYYYVLKPLVDTVGRRQSKDTLLSEQLVL